MSRLTQLVGAVANKEIYHLVAEDNVQQTSLQCVQTRIVEEVIIVAAMMSARAQKNEFARFWNWKDNVKRMQRRRHVRLLVNPHVMILRAKILATRSVWVPLSTSADVKMNSFAKLLEDLVCYLLLAERSLGCKRSTQMSSSVV